MKKLFIILSLFTLSVATFATTFRCNNNLGINNNTNTATFYRNFSEAYTAASNGDTIIVEPSSKNYSNIYDAAGNHVGYFDAWISKSLTIVGNGYWTNTAQQINVQNSAFNSLILNAPNITIYGLWFDGGIHINNNNLTIQRCRIDQISNYNQNTSNTFIKENFIQNSINLGSYDNTGLVITNNIIRIYGMNFNSTDVAIIENNIIGGVEWGWNDSRVDLGNCNAVFRNNIKRDDLVNYNNATVENNIAIGSGALPSGSGNVTGAVDTDIFEGTDFAYGTDVTFKLKTNGANPNPALNAGYYGNGDDIGAYNDGTNRPSYRDSGIPPFPAIYQLTTGSVNGNSINVTISTKANN